MTTPKVKQVGSAVVKFGAGGVGLAASVFSLKKIDSLIPASVPALIKNLAPGVATMLVAFFFSQKVSDDRAKALLLGMGAGGFIDALRKTLGSKIALINSATPALSGLGANIPYRAVNTGDFPPSYYKENAFQGLGSAYALSGSGVPLQGGISMQGPGAYSLSGNGAYALT